MKNNLTKSKVWQIIGVAVLCAVSVLTVVLGVVFGMNHSPEDLNVSKDMGQDGLVISQEVSKGITLMSGVATTAADGTTTKTITATVEPAGANEHDPLSWEVAFKDPSSTWANGKIVSDYVTIRVSADTLTCTVTCKQAFGEQIVLNVSSKTKNASASANVDYLKRVTDFTFTVCSEHGDSFDFNMQDAEQADEMGHSVGIVYGSETIQVPSYTFSWIFTYSTGTMEGSSYIRTASGRNFNNGDELQFDEQSGLGTDGDFGFTLYYNGQYVSRIVIERIDPVRSISVGDLVF